jgi:hypothetical protein
MLLYARRHFDLGYGEARLEGISILARSIRIFRNPPVAHD